MTSSQNNQDSSSKNQEEKISEDISVQNQPQQEKEQEGSEEGSAFEQENKDLKEKLLRCNADLQNIKRRAETDRVKARIDGAVSVINPLVKTIDDLSRAFDNIPESLEKEPFVQGVVAAKSNLDAALMDQGVEFFGEAKEVFDPNIHDSMMVDSNTSEGIVAQVFEKGVRYKGNVVRHAKVSVGSKKEE